MKINLTRPIAFIDIEATGINREADRIVEISICKLHPNGTREVKTRRINPEIPIPAAATEIHGISDDDVANESTFKDVSKSLLAFIAGCDLGGFTSLIDFSGQTVAHFEKHGFHLLGKHFIPTDVASENAQTYRLGYTENSKDGTKMGCGSPEYLLVFRKAPSDKSNAYADIPVFKSKVTYSRGRWQLDAHAMWLSNGNRLLNPEELRKLDLSQVHQIWKEYVLNTNYDYEHHVAVSEALDSVNMLPSGFMAVPTFSNNEWVWDDINRMHTLNTSQAKKKQEKHVCPLQFDIIDRAIIRYSNKGDTVYDPFGGIMSVPYRCVLKLDRFGLATELNENYWKDGVKYCQEAEAKRNVPSLFDTIEVGGEAA